MAGLKNGLISELKSVREFFNRSTNCLEEKDGDFKPAEGMLTVKEQVAHVAQTVDWFMDGMTKAEGFDMDFEAHWTEVNKVPDLKTAREWFERSIDKAIEIIESKPEEYFREPLPEGLVMGGEPKLAVISGISDHSAHHRGSLTVYSRLLGKEPTMPYMDA